MGLSPHLTLFYDHLGLFLALRSTRSALIIAILSWFVIMAEPYHIPLLYLVALALGFVEDRAPEPSMVVPLPGAAMSR